MSTNAEFTRLLPAGEHEKGAEDDVPGESGAKELETKDIAALIINKMIGTGIYVTPATVALLVQNKLAALCLWIFGGVYSYVSICVYLEYGMSWPYSGGEFFYITKLFPLPPLIAACSFAWVFVAFSNSVGNSFAAAKFLLLTNNHDPSEWLQKFFACFIVIAISFLHYRQVNIGVLANLWLAVGKSMFLLVLILAGFIGMCRDAAKGRLAGWADFVHTQTEVFATQEPLVGLDGNPRHIINGQVSATNYVVAILLVLFSYSGWENANYVTSEIQGSLSEKKRKLKRGALLAITFVAFSYVLFNLFLFLILPFSVIVNSQATVTADFAIQAFDGDSYNTRRAIYVLIALSACGNLVGVTFTNIRVKRVIARFKLIPFSTFFAMSSKYGQAKWDGLGTPSGGIVLHVFTTCIVIAATPFYPGSGEGLTFVVNLYTYAHSILSLALAAGLPFLPDRLRENDTSRVDPRTENTRFLDRRANYNKRQGYSFVKSRWARNFVIVVIVVINGFVVFAPFQNSPLPDGRPRKIPSYMLVVVIWLTYAIGALAGLYILFFSHNFEFKQSIGDTSETGFLEYDKRRWVFDFPKIDSWRGLKAVLTPQPWDECKRRWFKRGEADSAKVLRRALDELADDDITGLEHEARQLERRQWTVRERIEKERRTSPVPKDVVHVTTEHKASVSA